MSDVNADCNCAHALQFLWFCCILLPTKSISIAGSAACLLVPGTLANGSSPMLKKLDVCSSRGPPADSKRDIAAVSGTYSPNDTCSLIWAGPESRDSVLSILVSAAAPS